MSIASGDSLPQASPPPLSRGISALLPRYQKLLTDIVHDLDGLGVSRQELENFQNEVRTSAHTCRLRSCPRATIGFESKKLCTEHEISHVRRSLHPCTYSGCQYPPFFTSQALKAHASREHDTTTPRKSIRRSKPTISSAHVKRQRVLMSQDRDESRVRQNLARASGQISRESGESEGGALQDFQLQLQMLNQQNNKRKLGAQNLREMPDQTQGPPDKGATDGKPAFFHAIMGGGGVDDPLAPDKRNSAPHMQREQQLSYPVSPNAAPFTAQGVYRPYDRDSTRAPLSVEMSNPPHREPPMTLAPGMRSGPPWEPNSTAAPRLPDPLPPMIHFSQQHTTTRAEDADGILTGPRRLEGPNAWQYPFLPSNLVGGQTRATDVLQFTTASAVDTSYVTSDETGLMLQEDREMSLHIARLGESLIFTGI